VSGSGRSTILVLRILTPYDEGNAIIDGYPNRDRKYRDVLGPRDITNLLKRKVVNLPTNKRGDTDLNIIDPKSLNSFNIVSADFRKLIGSGSHAEWAHPQLKHPDNLVVAVLAPTHRDHAIIATSVFRPVALQNCEQLLKALIPFNLPPFFITPACAAH